MYTLDGLSRLPVSRIFLREPIHCPQRIVPKGQARLWAPGIPRVEIRIQETSVPAIISRRCCDFCHHVIENCERRTEEKNASIETVWRKRVGRGRKIDDTLKEVVHACDDETVCIHVHELRVLGELPKIQFGVSGLVPRRDLAGAGRRDRCDLLHAHSRALQHAAALVGNYVGDHAHHRALVAAASPQTVGQHHGPDDV